MPTPDVRWQQRFVSYKKALTKLKDAVTLSKQRPLSQLEKQGVIQVFEFTHELAWNVLKDFLQDQGNQNIKGSKDATREAFKGSTDHRWRAMDGDDPEPKQFIPYLRRAYRRTTRDSYY